VKKLLALTAFGEAAFGLVLLVYPPIVVRLLFNAGISGTEPVMCRVAGIALIALGVACWPGRGATQALWGMLTYSVLATLYLAYLGIEGKIGRNTSVAGGSASRCIDGPSGPRMDL
jgi:hypothetical protein